MLNPTLITKITSLSAEKQQAVEAYVDQLTATQDKGSKPMTRKAGLAKGMITMADDFDAPLEDFEDYES